MCTIVVHNIAQSRPYNFPSDPPDNHHCSDDVYLREVERRLKWSSSVACPYCSVAVPTCHYSIWSLDFTRLSEPQWWLIVQLYWSSSVRWYVGALPVSSNKIAVEATAVVNLLGIHSCMSSQMEPTPLNKIINWKETGSLPDSGIANVCGIWDLENFTVWPRVKSIQSPSMNLHDSSSVRLIHQHREDTGSVQPQCVHLQQRHTIPGNANAEYLRVANAIRELCALMYPQVNWDFVWSAGTILPRSPGCYRELI